MVAWSNGVIKEHGITYTGNIAVDIWVPSQHLLMLSDFNAVVIHFWKQIPHVSRSCANFFL